MATTPQANGTNLTMSNAPTARASPVPQVSSQPGPPQNQPQPFSNAHPTMTSTTGPLHPPNPTDVSGSDVRTGTSSSPRPHDARTLHLILSSLGITAYQSRVPLQLLDLAYRYTSSILSDAAHLAAEGYTISSEGAGGAAGTSGAGAAVTGTASKKAKQSNEGDVTLPALRLATSSRLGHSFAGQVPKSTMLEIAEERNRVRLPDVGGGGKVFGVRLPEERFLLTGRGWGLLEDEEGEGEGEEGDGSGDSSQTLVGDIARGGEVEDEREGDGDEVMGEGGEMEDEDENDGFDDVFGNGGGDEDGGEKMDDA